MFIRLRKVHYPPRRSGQLRQPPWMPGDVKAVSLELGTELINHWVAEPAPEVGDHDDWDVLRSAVGDRPGDPTAFIPTRQYLPFLRPGQSILIIRKVGGLGDVLHVSLLLNEIRQRYPDCPLTFATDRRYFQLFEGVDFSVIDQDDIYRDHTVLNGEISTKGRYESRFDVIEDVSTPCFLSESVSNYFGRDKLPWRARLHIWAEWIGLQVDMTRLASPVVITPAEIAQAKARHWADDGRKKIALAPRASAHMRTWQKVGLTGWAAVKAELDRDYDVRVFGVPGEPGNQEAANCRAYVAAMLAADCVLTVDSAAVNIAGIWRKPAVALYGITHGETYTAYYPTVQAIQACDTTCCNVGGEACPKRRVNQNCHWNVTTQQIVAAVKSKLEEKVEAQPRLRRQIARAPVAKRGRPKNQPERGAVRPR